MRRRRDGRLHLVRVTLEPGPGTERPGSTEAPGSGVPGAPPRSWVARPCPGQGSHQIRSMGLADGLAILPDGDGVDEGDEVEVLVTNPAWLG